MTLYIYETRSRFVTATVTSGSMDKLQSLLADISNGDGFYYATFTPDFGYPNGLRENSDVPEYDLDAGEYPMFI